MEALDRKKLILIGGGGHCASTVGVIESVAEYRIVGILDAAKSVGETVLGYPIVGNDDDIPRWVAEGAEFVVTIGQIGSPRLRKKAFDLVKQHGGCLPVIVASTAWVSPHASVGEGTVVFHKCVVNTEAVVGVNNILNTASIVEHNTIVGNDNHISTAVTINGDCTIGNSNFIGCGSIVHHKVVIGDNIIVGAGAVVIKDCLEEGTYIGVPARKKAEKIAD